MRFDGGTVDENLRWRPARLRKRMKEAGIKEEAGLIDKPAAKPLLKPAKKKGGKP